jgi:hypothetical protein
VTLPPGQNVVGPSGMMVGLTGVLLVVVTGADVAAQPLPSVTVTDHVPEVVT